MEAKSYSCPQCGGIMEFDAISGEMKCPYCDTQMSVDELNRINNNLNSEYSNDVDELELNSEHTVEGEFETGEKTGEFKVYRCKGCGAELLTDDNTTATFCSYCGNPTLIEDRLTGVIMPKYVIPFKHDKHSAREIYTKWAKKGILTPRMLYSSSTIEKITGIYVPFWLYDYDSITDLTARCTTVTRRVSGNTETTTTKYYDVTRQMKNQFDRVPADASIKMDDDKMDKLEPFDYSNLTDFEMPYLSGFYSEKYDYTSDDMKNRIEKRIADYALNETRNTIHGYSSVSIVSKNIRLKRLRADYALLPVWELYYTYNGKQYSFLMNGQTGKIVADRPVSKTRAIVIGVITYIAAFILFMILGGLFG